MINNENFISDIFNKYNINLSKEQVDKFLLYYNFLIEENEKYNLTAITGFEDVVFKHFLDSCLPYLYLKKDSTVIDVGSGAGFPGVPLKIIRPDLKITLLDSLNKRVNFLNQLILKLNLKDIKAIHFRVEDFAKTNREKFDYALSRAVAQVSTLSEYLLPLVKVKGFVLMYKSQKLEEELVSGKKAINILGGKIKSCNDFQIKEIESDRKILVIEKIKNSPLIYPRGKNLPKTQPLH